VVRRARAIVDAVLNDAATCVDTKVCTTSQTPHVHTVQTTSSYRIALLVNVWYVATRLLWSVQRGASQSTSTTSSQWYRRSALHAVSARSSGQATHTQPRPLPHVRACHNVELPSVGVRWSRPRRISSRAATSWRSATKHGRRTADGQASRWSDAEWKLTRSRASYPFSFIYRTVAPSTLRGFLQSTAAVGDSSAAHSSSHSLLSNGQSGTDIGRTRHKLRSHIE
jgi:hypothetical protein